MKNNQNPATAHHTITTARRPDNIRSSILVRGRSIQSMARSGRQPRQAIAPKGFTFSPFWRAFVCLCACVRMCVCFCVCVCRLLHHPPKLIRYAQRICCRQSCLCVCERECVCVCVALLSSAIISTASAKEVRQTQSGASISAARAKEVWKLAKAPCLRTNRSAIVLSVTDSLIVLIPRTNYVKNARSNAFCSTKV